MLADEVGYGRLTLAALAGRLGVALPSLYAAAERAVGAVYAILHGYGLSGDAAVDATRMFRAAVHGFITLEAAGGFGLPRDVDRSFDQMVAGLDTAYRGWRS